MEPKSDDRVIRITREEATSRRVDDLLQRQKSLRGEPGVVRDRRRAWYYQSWVVFTIVGLLGAAVAWAIIEPYFDDYHYWQGSIERLDVPDDGSASSDRANPAYGFQGTIVVRKQPVLLAWTLQEITADGGRRPIHISELEVGTSVGIYAKYANGVGLAYFLVRSPPPQSAKEAALTLAEQAQRSRVAGFLLFAVVAGCIGLFIGAADGLICRLPRRAALCGAVGLTVGFVGGLVATVLAEMVYGALHGLAMAKMASGSSVTEALGFGLQVLGRSLAWGCAGVAMGLGQGLALRSRRLLLYGLLGGVLGGLLGGLLFDPIDSMLLGGDRPSGLWSRLVGLCAIGGSVGAFTGLVELLARDMWLRMTRGPLAGKEFLLFKDVMAVGASPRSDIYLFNDSLVAREHAILRVVGNECDVEVRDPAYGVEVNDRTVQRARLRHGDKVTIGRTMFVLQRRKG